MTKQLTYANVDINGLHDDLIAAGIAPTYVGGVYDEKAKAEKPGEVEIHIGDEVDEAAVAAVVKAHDPARAEASRAAAAKAATDDDAALDQHLADATSALTVLAGSPTAAQQKAALLALGQGIALLLRRERRRRGA